MIPYSTFDAGTRAGVEQKYFSSLTLLVRWPKGQHSKSSCLSEQSLSSNRVLTGNRVVGGPLGKERSRHRVKPPCSIRAVDRLSGSSEQSAIIDKRRFGKTVARGSDGENQVLETTRIPATGNV